MSESRVGPFRIDRLLGRGGMGSVWAGVHAGSGHRCAVKVIRTLETGGTREAAELDLEVRAMAALDHPAVVRVFDHGLVEADIHEHVRAGAVWMAMELADGCAAESTFIPTDWAATRDLLRALLEGLGHAHGAGLLHRDVKLDNVLWFSDAPERAWRLADFGIALQDGIAGDQVVGTPRNMSPEQIRGTVVDQGPWSDLYGVGCAAWELLCGRPVFDGPVAAVLQAQLSLPPGPFHPRFPVPAELEPWLRRLLAKRIRDRFPSAAHAIAALGAMGPVDAGMPAEPPTLEPSDSVTWSTALFTAAGHVPDAPADVEEPTDWMDEPSEGWDGLALPVPPSWRGQVLHRDVREMGAGLGLLGVHEPRMVGREAERDHLWAALQAAVQTRRVQVVALDGVDGAGRTRLGRWLGRRAHELVGAWTWSVRPEPGLGVLWGSPGRDERLVGREAAGRASAALQSAIGEGVGVLYVDRADAWDDATTLVEVLAEATDLALVVVLDGIPRGASGAVQQLVIEPLPLGLHRDLVRAFAWPEPDLEAELAERAGGVPRMAEYLLSDLVRDGVLVPGPNGLRTDPVGAELPIAPVEHAAQRRLERAVGTGAVRKLLELAAVLGPDVYRVLLTRASGGRGDQANELEAALLDSGDAVSTDSGWSFSGRVLHRAALAMAAKSGRLPALHQAAAAVLVGDHPDVLRRKSAHLAGAGRTLDAAGMLIDALTLGLRRWPAVQQASAAAEAERLLDRIDADPEDPERARLALQRAKHAIEVMEQDVALAHLERAMAHGSDDVRNEAHHQATLIYARTGRLAEAEAHLPHVESWNADVFRFDQGVLHHYAGRYEEAASALKASADSTDARTRAIALRQLAYTEMRRERLGAAADCFREAARIHLRLGARFDAGMCRSGEAGVLFDLGRFGESQRAQRDAIRLLDSVGAPAVAVPLLNHAIVLLALDRVDEAHRTAERARRLFDRAGQIPLLAAAHGALLECHARTGTWSQAERALDELERLLAERPFHHRHLADSLGRSATAVDARGPVKMAERIGVLVRDQRAGLTPS